MLQFKRPMLACPLMPSEVEHTDANILAAMEKLRYPVLASLKKDGIRALRLNGSLLSRTLKPIPNRSIRKRSLVLPGGFDMELWNPSLSYDQIESIVMSQEHPDSDKIEFHVLDWFGKAYSYLERLSWIADSWAFSTVKYSKPEPWVCHNTHDLFTCFIKSEANNGEGICFRTPNSPYKQGRSTLKEQYLVKLCRFVREEVQIVDFEEQMCNANSSKRNAVGAMDRSSCAFNLIGKNTLGALVCIRRTNDVEQDIKVGTGFDDKLRREIWNNKDKWRGRMITIKYKPHGVKDKPRSPVYVGVRKEGY